MQIFRADARIYFFAILLAGATGTTAAATLDEERLAAVLSAFGDGFVVEETDREHGFRVEIEPGVHLPSRIEPDSEWEIDANLRVFDLETGKLQHDGQLRALHSYEGAYRINTPAGVFDTVLIREDFIMHVGPLKAEDDRFLFFAKGVGLVAELEAIRASALIVLRIKDDAAKVLVDFPGITAVGEDSR